MTLTLECLNSHGIGFNMSKTIEIDTKNEFLSLLVQNVWTLSYFALIGGGHLGFGPLAEIPQTFARGMGANFFLNISRSPNQSSNLSQLKMVTGAPYMTLLYVYKK